jgi:hypothetical protein
LVFVRYGDEEIIDRWLCGTRRMYCSVVRCFEYWVSKVNMLRLLRSSGAAKQQKKNKQEVEAKRKGCVKYQQEVNNKQHSPKSRTPFISASLFGEAISFSRCPLDINAILICNSNPIQPIPKLKMPKWGMSPNLSTGPKTALGQTHPESPTFTFISFISLCRL